MVHIGTFVISQTCYKFAGYGIRKTACVLVKNGWAEILDSSGVSRHENVKIIILFNVILRHILVRTT